MEKFAQPALDPGSAPMPHRGGAADGTRIHSAPVLGTRGQPPRDSSVICMLQLHKTRQYRLYLAPANHTRVCLPSCMMHMRLQAAFMRVAARWETPSDESTTRISAALSRLARSKSLSPCQELCSCLPTCCQLAASDMPAACWMSTAIIQ